METKNTGLTEEEIEILEEIAELEEATRREADAEYEAGLYGGGKPAPHQYPDGMSAQEIADYERTCLESDEIPTPRHLRNMVEKE